MRTLVRLFMLVAATAAAAAAYVKHDPTRDLVDKGGNWLFDEGPKEAQRLWTAGRQWLLKEEAIGATAKGGDGKGGPRRGPPPAPVTVGQVKLGDMPILITAPGTVEPLATVAVKTRVDGQIVEVSFTEGEMVTAGQILFKLDDRLVKAQLKQAEANIARDRSNLKDAETILQRRETLVKQKIVTEAATETQRQTVEQLKASIAASLALLDMQKTQLDYLSIKAPINGRTGSLGARLGSNVRAADATPLVTINQTKPISVAFAVAQTELAALRQALTAGAKAEVIAKGQPRPFHGVMSFVDNQVDRQTGTVVSKVVVANDDEGLWPGQSVEVVLTTEVRTNVLTVPISAVLPAQEGMIVWVVGADKRASVRPVVVERLGATVAYLKDGVRPGEQIVTEGQVRLAPGAPVIINDPAAPKGQGQSPGQGVPPTSERGKGGKKTGDGRS